VRRIVVIALSVILALVVAMPLASGNPASTEQESAPPGQLNKNLGDLTAEWWSWAFQDPSPLEGSYTDKKTDEPRCEGEYVEGLFFLAGSSGLDPVKRTCTVPADTPILFPVVNFVCSKATEDKPPYTRCAKDFLNGNVLVDSTTYARLAGKDLKIQRIASGPFQWTIESDKNPYSDLGLPAEAGIYKAASDGLWVYLEGGLNPGRYTLEFGGEFPNADFRQEITYNLKVV
jgi:hypothetical protein